MADPPPYPATARPTARAPPAGTPFRHDGNRRRVAEALAGCRYHAKPEKYPGRGGCPGAHEEPDSVQHRADDGHHEWSLLVLEPPARDERQPEHKDQDGEHRRDLGPRPSELRFERPDEDAPPKGPAPPSPPGRARGRLVVLQARLNPDCAVAGACHGQPALLIGSGPRA